MDITVLQGIGILLFILVVYGLASFFARRSKASKTYKICFRIVAVVATVAFVLWPVIFDSIFVEHFPDEATMPGPAFATFFFLVIAAALWIAYAIFRIIQNAVTKVRA